MVNITLGKKAFIKEIEDICNSYDYLEQIVKHPDCSLSTKRRFKAIQGKLMNYMKILAEYPSEDIDLKSVKNEIYSKGERYRELF